MTDKQAAGDTNMMRYRASQLNRMDGMMTDNGIGGWKPPVIYDISTDVHRAATQEDVDSLVAVADAYGRLKEDIQALIERSYEMLKLTIGQLKPD